MDQTSIYKITVIKYSGRCYLGDEFIMIWNFPSVGKTRAGGYLNATKHYNNIDYVIKYIQKYILHYPIKNITWEIVTPEFTIVEI